MSGITAARGGAVGLLCAAITAAVLAPPIPLPAGLPDLRVEQALALPAGLWLLGDLRRQCDRRTAVRAWLLPFAPLLVMTAVSIVYGALVLGEAAGPRDAFEVLKLSIYAVLFGFALRVCADPERRQAALATVLAAGTLSALIGLGQYLSLPGLVEHTGGWWAPAHHLRALERDGRAFGTVGNPNYYGALMALVAVMALGLRLPRPLTPRPSLPARCPPAPLSLLGLAAGTLGVVLSGSRGALGMLIAAALTVLVLALRRGGSRRAAPAAMATLAGAFVLSVLFVELLPRGRVDYLTRVAGTLSPTGDSGLALRLERWRELLGREQPVTPPAGSAPITDTGLPAASLEARARDERRRQDVRALVEAVRRHRDRTGAYPASLTVLAPAEPAALPVDPATGADYGYERTTGGFTVSARLENPADVDYPLYATGDTVNLLRNGSAEEGGDRAAEFRIIPGTAVSRREDAALYGAAGLRYTGTAAHTARRAAVYQQRALNRSGGSPFTAAVWVRHDNAVAGEVFLYVNIYYTDGSRQDPAARTAADPARTGIWQRLALTLTPDAGKRVDFLGVYLLSDSFQGQVSADGFLLVEGSVPVSFIGLAEGEPSGDGQDALARFRRSPLLGSGPGKAEDGATVDNEYLAVMSRYGLAGLIAYLWLWGLTAWRAARAGRAAAAAVAGSVAGLLLFSLVAGSLYHMQLMDSFWLLAGAMSATLPSLPAAAARSAPSTPG